MKVVVILLFPILMFGQTLENKSADADKSGFNNKVDIAFANAMKGVYFAFENIPERKNSISKDLVSDDELIAKVKISKEVGGVYVQSVGFYNTFKITAEIYRDYKSLKDEGLIEYIPR